MQYTPNRELRQIKELLIKEIELLKDMKTELEVINTNTKPKEEPIP